MAPYFLELTAIQNIYVCKPPSCFVFTFVETGKSNFKLWKLIYSLQEIRALLRIYLCVV